MSVFVMMIVVVACYTVCSLSDKYAVAKVGLDGNTLTWLMAAATSVFMLAYLPFDSRLFTPTVWSFAAIAALALLKYLEFALAAAVLKEMSAFELKAWLGLTVFASYITDLLRGAEALGAVTAVKFGCIAVTAAGLFAIARAGGEKIHYAKIVMPLVAYLASKYAYGLTVSLTQAYISPSYALFFALVILAVALLPAVHPITLFREKTKGALIVALTKIPNVIGLVLENAIAVQSMANYSFIQPMILVALFFIGIFRKEESSRLGVIGGIVCMAGILGFQAAGFIPA